MLYPCTFISCAQIRLEWLSSQQRTRAFYGEPPLAQVAITHVATIGDPDAEHPAIFEVD